VLGFVSGLTYASESPPVQPREEHHQQIESGRTIFNGKGICSYCHGVDGRVDERPQLTTDTAAVIARLNPHPVDLRNAAGLRLRTDRQRARLIREGHTGTGMLPDTRLTDREIRDLLAFLSTLRTSASGQ
jgi:cytochrome c553